MNVWNALLALLIFPGLLYALPMSWLMLGVERKARARMQSRIGPPLSQPFYDMVKLLVKSPVARISADERLLTALPLLSVASLLGALSLLPVFGTESGFAGDLVLMVGLLEMPALCLILAGYASRSIYGEVGATREAIVSIVSNVPFLGAMVAMATSVGSLRLTGIAVAMPWTVRIPALLAILICLPVKLRLNPFSLANAEQEVLSGPLAEYDGRRLAMWEIAHGLEWVVLTGMIATLLVPPLLSNRLLQALAFVAVSLALVPLFTLLASATARLKLAQATRLLWRGASVVAALALAAALVARHGGQ